MAYEILSGVVPFSRGTSIDTLLAHQDEPVPSLAQNCPSLPEELVQLIEAMLSKEPDGRPTLAAVRTVIKRLKGGKIPTMTAAGLSMPQISVPPVVVPHANTDENPTIDDRANESMYPTIQREPPARLSAEMLPLPPPPKTPMHGELPRADPFGSNNHPPAPRPRSPDARARALQVGSDRRKGSARGAPVVSAAERSEWSDADAVVSTSELRDATRGQRAPRPVPLRLAAASVGATVLSAAAVLRRGSGA